MVLEMPCASKNLKITVLNKVPLIQLPINLNLVESLDLEETSQYLLLQKPECIILDFSQTTFIDSSGIGVLIQFLKKTEKQGVNVIVWSISSRIKGVLVNAGIEPLLIFDETDAISLINNEKINNQHAKVHLSVNSRIKRAIDIIGSLIGLGLTSLLFIPIAIAIKLDSPGPVFFSQIRCGLLGKRFRIWKFRSMVVNAEALKEQVDNQVKGPFFKSKSDPRITQFGSFLRRTSLDELPQFWNVLKGDMSLVGTRPPTCDEVEQYILQMWQRLNVKPGITGQWQTNGRSEICDFNKVLELDLDYQRNWSIPYDIKLIIKTILIVLQEKSNAL
ncbi:sugar transferase [Gloeocapsopsis dulcis]|uniref:Anti-anti-sigma factor n=1 Tax=Gloeocapsopsis dulcis AAB1 = 1H9 TaxID=1433147 RepID=A0A6N8FS87_9CHRO|nr:sugar transferase [Gloeocapsopsis dulcis]MUL35811.1 anti-anti-sigma factor [Gloeocapsopsis dulcis AAB1 = 1H9]WNN87722.1 sugar transferase [Gloeocapsopsis dulcis]